MGSISARLHALAQQTRAQDDRSLADCLEVGETQHNAAADDQIMAITPKYPALLF